MKKTISFKISKEGKHYTASAVGFFIVTEGKSLDELSKNIREATELYFEDHNKKNKNNFNSISLNLPLYV
ncbi:MAG: type II toxin-antitoxin system HicB family antitoxin [Minisyncoccia bacterium]